MWHKLAVLMIPFAVLAATAGGGTKRPVAAAADCWCCTCQGAGCNCHTCGSGGTVCDNRGGAGCDVTGTCPIEFMDVFADGSAQRLAENTVLNISDDEIALEMGPTVRVVERLRLRDGWLVARDCGGLIVRRHVEAEIANAAIERTNTITLN